MIACINKENMDSAFTSNRQVLEGPPQLCTVPQLDGSRKQTGVRHGWEPWSVMSKSCPDETIDHFGAPEKLTILVEASGKFVRRGGG